MAKRIYVTGLRLAFETVVRYITKYEVRLRENLGDGGYAVVKFVCDLALVALQVIDTNTGNDAQWDGPIADLSPANINQVQAAIDAYNQRIGVGV